LGCKLIEYDVYQIETYHPVLWNGGKVRLHYAKAEDLAG